MAGNCGPLGCGEYTVQITTRCGGRVKCDVTKASENLEWGRTMDATSETKFRVTLSGDTGQVCCECLGETRTWINSVNVLRDGNLVWFGPVFNLRYRSDYVEVIARDITAWWDKRAIHNSYVFEDATLREIIETLMRDALAEDDPCELLSRVHYGAALDEIRIDRTVTAYEGYLGDIMRDLAKSYIDFTAIGSAVFIDAPLKWGPFTTLTDEHFQTELEVEERGVEAATRQITSGGDDGITGIAGGVDPHYGLLEELVSEDSIDTVKDARRASENRLVASNPAPLYLNIPDGAKLSPKAPTCIEQLVPGTYFKTSLRDVCRPIQTTSVLTALKVKVDPDEEVGITLSPPLGGSTE